MILSLALVLLALAGWLSFRATNRTRLAPVISSAKAAGQF
jgi:hypothetical protein